MGKTILVIDDEWTVRAAFAGALDELGYDVETAATGEEGLAKVNEQCPDLILLDLRMPGIDGVEVLRRLQAPECRCKEIPVYIVTAFRKEFFESLRTAAAEGLRFDIADKPLTIEQIQAAVRSKLEGPEFG